VTHRRSVRFDKLRRCWLITDSLAGEGHHDYASRFHCAPGLEADMMADGMVRLYDNISGARLFIVPLTENGKLTFERGFVSRDYGDKQASVIACWFARASGPLVQSWAIIPKCREEKDASVAELAATLRVEAASSQNQ
jgi:hypothetical protein